MKKWLLTAIAVLCIGTCAVGFAACGEDNSIPSGEHHFSEAWTWDASNHWHACTDEGCTQRSGTSPHSFGNDDECDICHYTRPPVHEHAWTEKYDEANHWQETTCTEHDPVQEGVTPHVYNSIGECECGVKQVEAQVYAVYKSYTESQKGTVLGYTDWLASLEEDEVIGVSLNEMGDGVLHYAGDGEDVEVVTYYAARTIKVKATTSGSPFVGYWAKVTVTEGDGAPQVLALAKPQPDSLDITLTFTPIGYSSETLVYHLSVADENDDLPQGEVPYFENYDLDEGDFVYTVDDRPSVEEYAATFTFNRAFVVGDTLYVEDPGYDEMGNAQFEVAVKGLTPGAYKLTYTKTSTSNFDSWIEYDYKNYPFFAVSTVMDPNCPDNEVLYGRYRLRWNVAEDESYAYSYVYLPSSRLEDVTIRMRTTRGKRAFNMKLERLPDAVAQLGGEPFEVGVMPVTSILHKADPSMSEPMFGVDISHLDPGTYIAQFDETAGNWASKSLTPTIVNCFVDNEGLCPYNEVGQRRVNNMGLGKNYLTFEVPEGGAQRLYLYDNGGAADVTMAAIGSLSIWRTQDYTAGTEAQVKFGNGKAFLKLPTDKNVDKVYNAQLVSASGADLSTVTVRSGYDDGHNRDKSYHEVYLQRRVAYNGVNTKYSHFAVDFHTETGAASDFAIILIEDTAEHADLTFKAELADSAKALSVSPERFAFSADAYYVTYKYTATSAGSYIFSVQSEGGKDISGLSIDRSVTGKEWNTGVTYGSKTSRTSILVMMDCKEGEEITFYLKYCGNDNPAINTSMYAPDDENAGAKLTENKKEDASLDAQNNVLIYSYTPETAGLYVFDIAGENANKLTVYEDGKIIINPAEEPSSYLSVAKTYTSEEDGLGKAHTYVIVYIAEVTPEETPAEPPAEGEDKDVTGPEGSDSGSGEGTDTGTGETGTDHGDGGSDVGEGGGDGDVTEEPEEPEIVTMPFEITVHSAKDAPVLAADTDTALDLSAKHIQYYSYTPSAKGDYWLELIGASVKDYAVYDATTGEAVLAQVEDSVKFGYGLWFTQSDEAYAKKSFAVVYHSDVAESVTLKLHTAGKAQEETAGTAFDVTFSAEATSWHVQYVKVSGGSGVKILTLKGNNPLAGLTVYEDGNAEALISVKAGQTATSASAAIENTGDVVLVFVYSGEGQLSLQGDLVTSASKENLTLTADPTTAVSFGTEPSARVKFYTFTPEEEMDYQIELTTESEAILSRLAVYVYEGDATTATFKAEADAASAATATSFGSVGFTLEAQTQYTFCVVWTGDEALSGQIGVAVKLLTPDLLRDNTSRDANVDAGVEQHFGFGENYLVWDDVPNATEYVLQKLVGDDWTDVQTYKVEDGKGIFEHYVYEVLEAAQYRLVAKRIVGDTLMATSESKVIDFTKNFVTGKVTLNFSTPSTFPGGSFTVLFQHRYKPNAQTTNKTGGSWKRKVTLPAGDHTYTWNFYPLSTYMDSYIPSSLASAINTYCFLFQDVEAEGDWRATGADAPLSTNKVVCIIPSTNTAYDVAFTQFAKYSIVVKAPADYEGSAKVSLKNADQTVVSGTATFAAGDGQKTVELEAPVGTYTIAIDDLPTGYEVTTEDLTVSATAETPSATKEVEFAKPEYATFTVTVKLPASWPGNISFTVYLYETSVTSPSESKAAFKQKVTPEVGAASIDVTFESVPVGMAFKAKIDPSTTGVDSAKYTITGSGEMKATAAGETVTGTVTIAKKAATAMQYKLSMILSEKVPQSVTSSSGNAPLRSMTFTFTYYFAPVGEVKIKTAQNLANSKTTASITLQPNGQMGNLTINVGSNTGKVLFINCTPTVTATYSNTNSKNDEIFKATKYVNWTVDDSNSSQTSPKPLEVLYFSGTQIKAMKLTEDTQGLAGILNLKV